MCIYIMYLRHSRIIEANASHLYDFWVDQTAAGVFAYTGISDRLMTISSAAPTPVRICSVIRARIYTYRNYVERVMRESNALERAQTDAL